MSKNVGLQSLNAPIDATTVQSRLTFNIFASLAEFEREVIRKRTNADLEAACARGKKDGRPKGLDSQAQQKAMIAVTLYKEQKLSTKEIAYSFTVGYQLGYSLQLS